MSLYQAEDGSRWWICNVCDFCYPFGWQEGDDLLEHLAENRREFERSMKASA